MEQTEWGPAATGSRHNDTIALLAMQPDLLLPYEGEWVAIEDRRVIAHDPSVIEVVRQARAKGFDDPLLVPVPPAGYLVG